MIGILWRACHPLPAAAVTLLSGVLAIALGASRGTAALAAASIGLSQLSVGWANDMIDYDRDRIAGRLGKPLVRRPDLIGAVRVACVTATALTVIAALAWGWPRGGLLLVALVCAQLYNRPLKATRLSMVPYLVCFAVLPAFLSPDAPLWLIAAASLLGGSAHLLNAIPDLADDALTGVNGLPQRLGARRSLLTASALLMAATVTLVLGAQPPWWAAAIAVLAAAAPPVLGLRCHPRTTFRAVLVVAAIDVTLLVISGAW